MSDCKILYTLVILFSTLIISCSSDSPVDPGEENIPLGNFSLIAPQNESTIVYDQPHLSWDEAEDSVDTDITYEVRLNQNNPPSEIIASGLERTEYTPEQDFEPGSTYYWQIIANRGSGEKTKSKEIFSFTFIEGSGVIANEDLGMSLRHEHSLEFFENKLWIFAGLADGHAQSDIWYSENAIEWEKAVDSSDFPPRLSHTSLVFNDKIWIIGGTVVGNFFDDVWSTDDGINWTEITNSAPFGLRYDHSSVVFDNKIWVIAGHVIHQDKTSEETVNDLWFSTNGEDWTQATDSAGFQPRLNHKSVVFDDKIWVIGGMYRRDGPDIYFDDVWYSENGIDWTLATDDIGIGNISNYESVVYDGKIWLIGGKREEGGLSGEIWYSSDGASWSKAPPFFGRVGHAVTVFQDKIWGVGGASQDSDPSDVNDSWYLNLP